MNGSDYFAWSYAAQKFDESKSVLARHFGKNWERMTYAVMPLTILQDKDFPDADLHQRTKSILAKATRHGPLDLHGKQYWGSIEHTMRRSKRATFEALANEILLIDEQIRIRRGDPPN
jgi:hypothetical protein